MNEQAVDPMVDRYLPSSCENLGHSFPSVTANHCELVRAVRASSCASSFMSSATVGSSSQENIDFDLFDTFAAEKLPIDRWNLIRRQNMFQGSTSWMLIFVLFWFLSIRQLVICSKRRKPTERPERKLPKYIVECFFRRRWNEIGLWVDKGNHRGTTVAPTALHYAIAHRAPQDLVDRLIPDLAHMTVPSTGETALHWSVRLGAHAHGLALLKAAPETIVSRDTELGHCTPLGLVWDRFQDRIADFGRRPEDQPQTWKMLVQLLAWNATVDPMVHRPMFSPIHAAARCAGCPLSLLKFLCLEKSTALLESYQGRTPLLWSCANATPFIAWLVESEPRAVHIRESTTGRLPLHVAIEAGVEWHNGLEDLVLPAQLENDPVTGFPLFLQARHNLPSAFHLLRMQPSRLQQSRGLLSSHNELN